MWYYKSGQSSSQYVYLLFGLIILYPWDSYSFGMTQNTKFSVYPFLAKVLFTHHLLVFQLLSLSFPFLKCWLCRLEPHQQDKRLVIDCCWWMKTEVNLIPFTLSTDEPHIFNTTHYTGTWVPVGQCACSISTLTALAFHLQYILFFLSLTCIVLLESRQQSLT